MSELVKTKTNYRISLFCIVTMLFWFAMYTYVPILSVYVEQLGANHEMAGVIVGGYGLVQMLLRIPLGISSDRIHKRKLFINFGLFFAFFSSIGLWLFRDLNLILIFRALAGAAAATWVDFTVLFTSYYHNNESTKAIGIINFFNAFAQMLAMLIGGWFAENVGNGSTFLLGAVVGAAGLIVSFYIVDNWNENDNSISFKQVVEVVKDRTLIIVSILAIITQLLTFSTVFGFTPVFAQSIGASKFDMGLLTTFSQFPNALASLIGGALLSKKLGEKRVIIIGFLLMGIFTITIPFIKIFWIFLLTQAIAGLGRGFSFTLLMGMSIRNMPIPKRATAMGFFQSIYGLGMFLGPVLTGFLGDLLNLRDAFVLLGIFGCGAAVLSKIIIKDTPKEVTSRVS